MANQVKKKKGKQQRNSMISQLKKKKPHPKRWKRGPVEVLHQIGWNDGGSFLARQWATKDEPKEIQDHFWYLIWNSLVYNLNFSIVSTTNYDTMILLILEILLKRLDFFTWLNWVIASNVFDHLFVLKLFYVASLFYLYPRNLFK